MDPVADMITIIRNGYLANKNVVSITHSKFKEEIAKTLSKEGFVGNIKKEASEIQVELIYTEQQPKIHEIRKISKLGLRVYQRAKKLQNVKGGRGVYILSTPKGVMSSKEAKEKNIGGEVICLVW